ncbi:MAG TPA: BREX system Lon protease-like protein BrxL [Synergistales bacterium]|nr:BREX system Lon protease-like protein BrxL [Synergistales bacterium]HPC76310.1 BREX system Lon protease-like protein BrxL [Synergistales bacterium]HRS48904.1 BREX system Lon protease-like protein BrxL [Thermovirgaceae bacterium]HRU91164.1 BREX system Lon protease-like protein BrxL [Thermovirgaceae bacterium]
MTELDKKINEIFPGLVVRKDLTKLVKGNAIVPSYVLEYLLGQYCATDDENTILSGVERVKEILAKHYVHRNEAALVRSRIKEKGRHKVIDKITVDLNDKTGCYEAVFSNLGIKGVLVDSSIVKKHQRLLVGGVWCIADMEFTRSEDPRIVPWIMGTLKPIQVSHFDIEKFIEGRKQFSTEEWIDLIIQTIGFNPEQLSLRNKMFQITRLVCYCERNYNLLELGPKGTGKSHLFSEFSPHGILISGGEVTVAKLFVNNTTGKVGLVGYWDSVAFDEFAGMRKKVDKSLVDILKNYMANKSFSRGTETLGAEASMAFLGNTKRSVPYMLKHSDLFDELPEKYRDTAFLDRLHCYIPGWEVDILRGELFTSGYGFIVDYFAEILKYFRNEDYSLDYNKYFELNNSIAQRDLDGIKKTFSGLMKILYPGRDCSKEEIQRLLAYAIEGRKRVKGQLLRMDETYIPVVFSFTDKEKGKEYIVKTLEENQYPEFFGPSQDEREEATPADVPDPEPVAIKKELKSGKHIQVMENQKGISFEKLFADYLRGAASITIQDPYIRYFYQAKNLSELIQLVIRIKPVGEEVDVKLVTKRDDSGTSNQEELLNRLQENLEGSGVNFSYVCDESNTLHDRYITTDTGWKIILGRGLDLFQPYDYKDAFSLPNNIQEERLCKAFEVTYIRKTET